MDVASLQMRRFGSLNLSVMLIGAQTRFVDGQRISLSSCESELHSLVSTLCDGVYIKRCLEFVVGAIQHVLLTDSSSARQLVNRQGRGKLKHVDGKILWIQEHVRQGSVCICQVSTVGMWQT